MSESSKPKLKEYQGSCHCGNFKYTVKLPEIEEVYYCNCSYCSRIGYYWVFPVEQIVVEKGEGSLKTYQFGKESMEHKFCPTCGSSVLSISHDRGIGLNSRMFRDHLDLAGLKVKNFDGAALPPTHEPPEPVSGLKATEGKKVYQGSCHCGAVKFALQSDPLTSAEDNVGVNHCDCSICGRNAYLWLYPKKSDVVKKGENALTGYSFGPKRAHHKFCSTCGVNMFNDVHHEGFNLSPLNVRALNDIDLDALKIGDYPPSRGNFVEAS